MDGGGGGGGGGADWVHVERRDREGYNWHPHVEQALHHPTTQLPRRGAVYNFDIGALTNRARILATHIKEGDISDFEVEVYDNTLAH